MPWHPKKTLHATSHKQDFSRRRYYLADLKIHWPSSDSGHLWFSLIYFVQDSAAFLCSVHGLDLNTH